VLVRAATRHGASVVGVELDPVLARSARDLLANHGIDGTVLEADFDGVPIDADVVFAYLSPATLQRLRPRLGACPAGTRLVTAGYPVPGWDPDDAADRCYLYRLPATETAIDRRARGWDHGAVLVALRPDAPSLVALKVHHQGGEVVASISGAGLDAWAVVRTGADTAGPGDEVIVDIRFEPGSAGTVGAGLLDVRGQPSLPVFAVVDDGQPGVWGLSPAGCGVVGRALVAGDTAPVLAAARQAHPGPPARAGRSTLVDRGRRQDSAVRRSPSPGSG
jgi:hypothetical protein